MGSVHSDASFSFHCSPRYNSKLDAPFLRDHSGVEESESKATDERATASRTHSWTWPDVSRQVAVNTATPLTRMLHATVRGCTRHKVLLASQIR